MTSTQIITNTDNVVKINSESCDNYSQLSISNLENLSDTYLPLSFLKTIPKIESDGAVWSAQYNYDNYDLFCLIKSLYPLFSSLNLTFELKSYNLNGYMNLCVLPKLNGSTIKMSASVKSKLLAELNFITTVLADKAILWDPTDQNIFPKDWMCNVFPYIPLSSEYNCVLINGKLYITMDPLSEFDRIYESAHQSLINKLSEYYIKGIIAVNLEFATAWNLKPFINGLYIPNWIDTRITADPIKFLLGLNNNKYITLQILPDLLLRHILTQKYKQQIIFDIQNQTARIYPQNIKDVYDFLEIIETYKHTNYIYSIYTTTTNDVSVFDKYCKIVSNQYPNSDYVSYKIANNNYKYMYSIVVYEVIKDMNVTLKGLLT
jgi:hypothetical protein